jgi:hypothetical protein
MKDLKTEQKKKRWYHDDIEWKFEQKLVVDPWNLIIFFIMLNIAAGFTAFALETVSELRSQDARFACSAAQLDSRRYMFTDSVVCVPYPTRRDTVTFEALLRHRAGATAQGGQVSETHSTT